MKWMVACRAGYFCKLYSTVKIRNPKEQFWSLCRVLAPLIPRTLANNRELVPKGGLLWAQGVAIAEHATRDWRGSRE